MPADLSERALISIAEARRYVYRGETDDSRQDILIDAINDVSASIWDECDREFLPTTVFARSGADGVGNGTTTFTSATAIFVAEDEESLLEIAGDSTASSPERTLRPSSSTPRWRPGLLSSGVSARRVSSTMTAWDRSISRPTTFAS